MGLHASDIGSIALVCSVGLSFLLLWWGLKISTRFNIRLTSRYYLSPLAVLVFYLLVFSFFIFTPLLFASGIGSLLAWLHEIKSGSSIYGSSGEMVASLYVTQLFVLGLFEYVMAAFFSYRNFLKQSQ